MAKLKDARKAFRSLVPFKLRMALLRGLSTLVNGNLNYLAILHDCDKWNSHFYTPHYDTHLRSRRWKKLKLLEIGVGGYDRPDLGGASLRMWKYFFPRAQIFAVDIHDKSQIQEKRIRIFQGSQTDRDFLQKTTREIGPLDIIIDDGSHRNSDVIETFLTLFPHLKEGGIYVVEDTQTSYWPDYGGDWNDVNAPQTMMNFFKSLPDGLNYSERPYHTPTYLDLNIVSVHFYHNLVFIYKGANVEKSNVIGHPDYAWPTGSVHSASHVESLTRRPA